MSREPVLYAEDTSRLTGKFAGDWCRYIYEPLELRVTEEDLVPYCYLLSQVALHDWRTWPEPTANAKYHTRHRWASGDVVESDGQRYELVRAKCVYRDGQWCMRWFARRTDRPLWCSADFLEESRGA